LNIELMEVMRVETISEVRTARYGHILALTPKQAKRRNTRN